MIRRSNGENENSSLRGGNVQPEITAILEYFGVRPRAKDTAEGIARWWVGGDPTRVRKALDLLAQRGVLRKRMNYGRDIYARAE